MALILAVDTSAVTVSCALVRDEKILAAFDADTGLTHSQTLLPMVEQLFRITGLTPSDVDAYAVNAGPGSFTGVRIGVSAVKGLAFADKKPCISVSTLECMAQRVSGIPMDARIVCTMDARCQQVYTAIFSIGEGGTIHREMPDSAMAVEELKKILKNEKKSVFLVGDGSEMCYNAFKNDLPSVSLAPVTVRYQNAVGTALAASRLLADGKTVTAEELLPTYLRLPQAERELRLRREEEKTQD